MDSGWWNQSIDAELIVGSQSCFAGRRQVHFIGRIYGPPTLSNPPLLPSDYELTEPRVAVHESRH